jgi:hypothetical protein
MKNISQTKPTLTKPWLKNTGFKLDGRLVNTEDQVSIITALKGFLSAYDNHRYNEVLDKVSSISPKQQSQQLFTTSARPGKQRNTSNTENS